MRARCKTGQPHMAGPGKQQASCPLYELAGRNSDLSIRLLDALPKLVVRNAPGPINLPV